MSRKLKPGDTLIGESPILLSEFNPKACSRFADRLCRTCNSPIMLHWLIPFSDPEKRGSYWCDAEGNQMSEGMAE